MPYILELQITDPSLKPLYEKSLSKLSSKEYCENPHKDSGFDLYLPQDVELEGNKLGVQINQGIRCAAYKLELETSATRYNCSEETRLHYLYKRDWMKKSPAPFYLYPRSSISKTPFRLANNVGIIDSGYRGNIIGAFDNLSEKKHLVKAGSRLLQICMPDLMPFDVVLVDELDSTSRGAGGFGSTGR
jgi:hypothetical protein